MSIINILLFLYTSIYYTCAKKQCTIIPGQNKLQQLASQFNNITSLIRDESENESSLISSTDLIEYSREDVKLNMTQLLTKYGYENEVHEVITEDGYILTLYRIPSHSQGPPVLVMHGLASSSDDWVTLGPGSALAYELADAGYDVWLGNFRGNQHSRKHVNLTIDCKEYWDFTWHEYGVYDLPAFIDYILRIRSDYTQIGYIGHSMGNTVFLVMTSEKPEFNDKVAVSVMLSLVAYMRNIRSIIVRAMFKLSIADTLQSEGIYRLDADDPILVLLKSIFCNKPLRAAVFCSTLKFIIAGFNYAQLNLTALPVIYSSYPGSALFSMISHYGQIFESDKFRRYDYGIIKNLRLYGSATPPDYPVHKVKTNINVIYSDNDWLSNFTDVERMVKRLSNVVDVYRVPDGQFCHTDYLFAKDVKPLVYERVLYYLSKHFNNNG